MVEGEAESDRAGEGGGCSRCYTDPATEGRGTVRLGRGDTVAVRVMEL